ncbi:MAG: hypothetical protein AAGA48_16485 [Myxococcota bacterium]
MLVSVLLASIAMADKADCAKLEGDAKAACVREASRTDLEAQIKELGACDQEKLVERAACLQDKADLAQRIADLYAAALPKPKGKAKLQRSNTNRMEADVTDE